MESSDLTTEVRARSPKKIKTVRNGMEWFCVHYGSEKTYRNEVRLGDRVEPVFTRNMMFS